MLNRENKLRYLAKPQIFPQFQDQEDIQMAQPRPNFDALRDLHDSANDLLHSPIIKKTIAHHGQEKWVHEISEASLRILESCSNTKDVLLLVKDHLQDLQSTFRRVSVGETAAVPIGGNKFAGFSIQRKKLKKAMLKRLQSLKGMNNKCITSSSDVCSMNQDLNIVINVLREVRMTTMSVLESLMSLMSMPSPRGKSNKLGFFESKLSVVNSLSSWEKYDAVILQGATKRLEAVEIAIEDLEEELECIFRRLIRTRVSLLNILTN